MAERRKIIYKIYQPDGTYIKTLNDVANNFHVINSINGGQGEVVIRLSRDFDDYNDDSIAVFNNILKVYIKDSYNTGGIQVYTGFLSGIDPAVSGKEEFVELTFLGAVSKLSIDMWRTGSDTDNTVTDQDPSQTVKDIIDNHQSLVSNAIVSYNGSIESTGESHTYNYVDITHLDALRKTLEMCPYDWYFYVDETGDVQMHQLSATADHAFTVGKDIIEIKTHKTIEGLINYLIFWNTRQDDDPLYLREEYEDATSQSNYETHSSTQTDQRVTNTGTSDLMGNAVINENKDPKVRTTLVIGSDYDLASIKPGQTCKIRNINSGDTTFNDNMKIVRVDYMVDRAVVELAEFSANANEINLGGLGLANKRIRGLEDQLNNIEPSMVDVSIQGWSHNITFEVTDANTVEWGAGTLKLANGKEYSIDTGNTGDMSALTYIYIDVATSLTAFQTSTTATDSVGAGKILVAVAKNSANEALFQVFGGEGGVKLTGANIEERTITATQIQALTITSNEIATNTITANELATNSVTASEADLASIFAENIEIQSGGSIYLGQGSYDSGTGFWLGDDSGTTKFSLGNSAGNNLTWNGTTLSVTGTITASAGQIAGFSISSTEILGTKVGLRNDSGDYGPVIYVQGTSSNNRAGLIGGGGASNNILIWAGSNFDDTAIDSAPTRIYQDGSIITTGLTSTGGTITGGTIQTASSGWRFQMDGTGDYPWKYWNGTNATMWADTSGNIGLYGSLMWLANSVLGSPTTSVFNVGYVSAISAWGIVAGSIDSPSIDIELQTFAGDIILSPGDILGETGNIVFDPSAGQVESNCNIDLNGNDLDDVGDISLDSITKQGSGNIEINSVLDMNSNSIGACGNFYLVDGAKTYWGSDSDLYFYWNNGSGYGILANSSDQTLMRIYTTGQMFLERGALKFGDNKELQWGSDADIHVRWDATNSRLQFRNVSGTEIWKMDTSGNVDMKGQLNMNSHTITGVTNLSCSDEIQLGEINEASVNTAGMIHYNSSLNKLRVCENGTWKSVDTS